MPLIAGWITSRTHNIPPKTLLGDWEPIVTTEEFERGLRILEDRNQKRVRRRKHDYLLRGLVYYEDPSNLKLIRLTCSTSNSRRPAGGTPYYCIARSNINFACLDIDNQIAQELSRIQVNPSLVPAIRAAFRQDIAEKISSFATDEPLRLQHTLKAVDEEEARMARLYAAGKITESIWDNLWREWQDRRNKIRATLEVLRTEHHTRHKS